MICINFSANRSNPADFECHDIALKGIKNLFFGCCRLSGGECFTLHETFSGKSHLRQESRSERTCIFFFFFFSIFVLFFSS